MTKKNKTSKTKETVQENKLLVKCPNCKTKFIRSSEAVEKCGVCEKEGLFKAVKK